MIDAPLLILGPGGEYRYPWPEETTMTTEPIPEELLALTDSAWNRRERLPLTVSDLIAEIRRLREGNAELHAAAKTLGAENYADAQRKAALWNAAPDLLEACKAGQAYSLALLRLFKRTGGKTCPSGALLSRLADEWQNAMGAAIAQAEGNHAADNTV